MSYIFLDESGDLGFNFNKKSTSKFFVITFLFTNNKRPIEKAVRDMYSGPIRIKRNRGVLHATKERPVIRKRLLKALNEKDCYVMAIYLDKAKVYTRLKNEKQVLYNYVTNILLDRVFTKSRVLDNGKITLIASRRETNKFLNENFRNYINSQIKNRHKRELLIEIKAPSDEKCLQAVDFVSWAIFRKYERGETSYYNLIKRKIVEENALFR